MIGILLPFVLGFVLFMIVRASGETNRRFIGLLLFGYAIRFALQAVSRHVQFFSHVAGGDSFEYEAWAHAIVTLWQHHGIHFVTQTELPELGPTSLPSNAFALVMYLNDGPTESGCLSVVAFAAALAVLNVRRLSMQLGASDSDSLLISLLLYFGPTFLFYTSDLYKDGLVVSLTVGALASTMRLTQKLTIMHAFIGIACTVGLWYVRFYLVFVTIASLLVGFVGLRSRSVMRPILAALILTCAALVLIGSTDFLQIASERAADTFEVGTAMAKANATSGGSSVEFDDGGSPFGSFVPKLLYTIFSPFFWSSGTAGFQIGKVDALIWYYIIYRAARGARVADFRVRMPLATFIVPCTVMYAMTMANVGLIVRQRLVIVFATSLFAGLREPSAALASDGRHRTLQQLPAREQRSSG